MKKQFLRNDQFDPYRKKGRMRSNSYGLSLEHDGSFHCLHCKMPVSTHPLISGVNHRNHCPFCLWSKHVDLYESGDRLAACKGQMEPVALTHKRMNKKYMKDIFGELMLVHRCVECDELRINRIAADDSSELIYQIFLNSLHLDSILLEKADRMGILILDERHENDILTRIYGRRSEMEAGFVQTSSMQWDN